MQENKQLPVPLARQVLEQPVKTNSFPVNQLLGFLVAINMAVAVALYIFASPALTAVWVGCGVVVLSLAYIALKKFADPNATADNSSLLAQAYQPHFQLLYRAGYEKAIEHSKAIARGLDPLKKNFPQLFGVIDETHVYVLQRLCSLAETQLLVGEKTQLKRKLERVQHKLQTGIGENAMEKKAFEMEVAELDDKLNKVEKLQEAALGLTQDLHRLVKEIEDNMMQKAVGSEADRAKLLLLEKIEIEKRVAEELKLLGPGI